MDSGICCCEQTIGLPRDMASRKAHNGINLCSFSLGIKTIGKGLMKHAAFGTSSCGYTHRLEEALGQLRKVGH